VIKNTEKRSARGDGVKRQNRTRSNSSQTCVKMAGLNKDLVSYSHESAQACGIVFESE
jgi:hypothetical protein